MYIDVIKLLDKDKKKKKDWKDYYSKLEYTVT